tara:strand:+ start:4001 stop:4693 length:693 start_codon:yes stop_codon:yes gene_type:complete
MEVKRFGDQACIIGFEEIVSTRVHHRVMSFYRYFVSYKMDGITDLIPSYNALTIVFDPMITHFEKLKKEIEKVSYVEADHVGRTFSMPVCYENAIDQDAFCDATGLSWHEIVDIHTSNSYHVYMVGFLPGFLYMGEVDKAIQLPRKKIPRKKVEAGSVGIAGAQTGVYPIASPGGWNILGRTPVSIFQPAAKNPFPIEVGDKIIFYPISKNDFQTISADKGFRMEVVGGV